MQSKGLTRFTRRAGGAAATALMVPLSAGVRLAQAAPAGGPDLRAGGVYSMTNSSAGNAIAIFARAADGSLSAQGTLPTGGTGTGGGLGSQGALALSQSGQWLYAVNAGSDDLSVFQVTEAGLAWRQKIGSGGQRPVSLTTRGQLLYVLNAGGNGNISGFLVGSQGMLAPLSGSTRDLGGGATSPAQVSFSPDGRFLVVTEKAANAIATYRVGQDGRPGLPVIVSSSGAVPFGFDFAGPDILVVSEASGGASSYALGQDGTLAVRSASVPDRQVAACWAVVTENGRYAYVANGGSGSISGYTISPHGQLFLLDANGITASTGAGSHPTDEALSAGSRFLYVLLTPSTGAGGVAGFAAAPDGSLQSVGTVTGLPMSAVGLAAR